VLGHGTAYYGSLRAYLDSEYFHRWNNYRNKMLEGNLMAREVSEKERFGLIYLDYCSKLTCGFKSVEKNPIADIETLFKYSILSLDPGSHSILAVCFCISEDKNTSNKVEISGNKEEEDLSAEKDNDIDSIVKMYASKHGYFAEQLPETGFEYGVVKVVVFKVKTS